jgi:hypothetical protein
LVNVQQLGQSDAESLRVRVSLRGRGEHHAGLIGLARHDHGERVSPT